MLQLLIGPENHQHTGFHLRLHRVTHFFLERIGLIDIHVSQIAGMYRQHLRMRVSQHRQHRKNRLARVALTQMICQQRTQQITQ